MNPYSNKFDLTTSESDHMEVPKEMYEHDTVEHELISRYKPKFLARGGEHIVYEVQGHHDIVVKVSTGPLKKIIKWNIEHEQPVDSLPTQLEPRIREYLNEESARYQQLRKYFGVDNVPNQKEFLVKIPITKDILDALYEGNAPITTNEVWCVVMVQKRVEALSDPNRLAIVTNYAEKDDVSEDVYNQATEHLVFGMNTNEKMDRSKLLEIQSHGDLKALLEKSESDNDLRESVRELIEKIIIYSEETGEIFDLAGQDNIVFFQRNGVWSYSLVDTRYPGDSKMIEKAKIVLLKLSAGSEIDDHEKNILLNIFNFVRTINGLAEQMGVQKRINIVPEGMKKIPLDFLKIIR